MDGSGSCNEPMKSVSAPYTSGVSIWPGMTQARLPACSEFQIGRFRKGQRVGGCGKARCYLCHGEKLCKRPTPQQRRADISYKEWLHELCASELVAVFGCGS